MQRNARLDDLCKRLLAPFTLLLEEVERLLNATVAEERATGLHQPEPDGLAASERVAAESGSVGPRDQVPPAYPKVAAARGLAALPPGRATLPLYPALRDNFAPVPAVERQFAATMPPMAARMPRRGDSLAALPQAERETGQPPSEWATIQSVQPALPTAGSMPAQVSAPKADASVKSDDSVAGPPPATAVPEFSRYHGRPAIRLAPRASAVRPSRPVTTPSSAATESPPVTATVPPSPASDNGIAGARRATPGSAGVPAGLQQNHTATGEHQAMPVSRSQPAPPSTSPATAPANRQGIPLIPHPVQQAAARLVDGVEPVLERAYRLTQSALSAPVPEPPAAQENPVRQVHNTFNVAVSLNPAGTATAAGVDREALQEALVELLRTAARRQGLEV